MGSYDDLRNILKHISDETGDKNAWQQGLTPQQVRDVDGWLNSDGTGYKGFRDPQTGVIYEDRGGLNTKDTPQVPDDALDRLRGQHPTLFDPTTKAAITPAPGTARNTPGQTGQTGNGQAGNGQVGNGNTEATVPTAEQNKGEAAKAAKKLEDKLQDVNDSAVEADRELAQAVLNAHATTAESAQRLNDIQVIVREAVNSTALDTPMGRREFKRFLIGKIEEIRGVLTTAKLDAESQKNALTALADYFRTNKPDTDQQQQGNGNTEQQQQQGNGQGGNGGNGGGGGNTDPGLPGGDLGGDLGGIGDPALGGPADPLSQLAQSATPALQSAAQIPAQLAGIPGQIAGGMGSLPGMFGGAGANNPGSHLTDPFNTDDNKTKKHDSQLPDDAELASLFGDEPPTDNGDNKDNNSTDHNSDNKDNSKEGKPDDHPKPGEPVLNPNAPGALPTTGPTPVTIGGVVYTADNPKLAAALTDISKGATPLEAFRKYDIAIPPPTSPPAAPLDPSQLKFGSYATYTNGDIVVALDKQRAIIDGQVQPISSAASKPGFIAWQNPPAPTGAPAAAPIPVIATSTPGTPATPTPPAAPITQTSGHTGTTK